jgi:hypothetical protein
MEQHSNGNPSVRTEAIAALLSVFAGSGAGWLVWFASSNIGVAIGIAGPIAALTNVSIRKVFK